MIIFHIILEIAFQAINELKILDRYISKQLLLTSIRSDKIFIDLFHEIRK